MGYTPVFDSVFEGTLCGKWPTLPVWLTILPLADWRGHIDMTLQAISVRSGWPVDLLKQGISELCLPDADSRSPDEEGRRLVPIEPGRLWGWRVVNIHLYRGKCNDENQNARQVADGRNAAKVKRYRERHRPTPPDTVTTPSDSVTHTHTHTKNKNQEMSTSSTELVFEHWKKIHNHPRAILDSNRRRLIECRLKDFKPEDLCKAIDGYKLSEWHQGKNDKHQVYDALSLMLRNSEYIEKGITLAEGGKVERWI